MACVSIVQSRANDSYSAVGPSPPQILFEIPSNLMLKKIGPSKWIPLVMVAWGIVMCCMAAVTSTAGLLVSRFFLGITEAGLFPGIIFLLSLWFLR